MFHIFPLIWICCRYAESLAHAICREDEILSSNECHRLTTFFSRLKLRADKSRRRFQSKEAARGIFRREGVTGRRSPVPRRSPNPVRRAKNGGDASGPLSAAVVRGNRPRTGGQFVVCVCGVQQATFLGHLFPAPLCPTLSLFFCRSLSLFQIFFF